MRRAGTAVAGFGWRGMLALVGGVASIAGIASLQCGLPAYGPWPKGDASCDTEAECTASHGPGWYCDSWKSPCVERIEQDAGSSP